MLSFDSVFVNLNTKSLDDMCSHLLAHDFVDNRFTLVLKSSVFQVKDKQFISKTLVVNTGNDKIELELGRGPSGSIKYGNNITSILPISTGEIMVTRELNLVTISSHHGFQIECNLLFDVCSFKLSGW